MKTCIRCGVEQPLSNFPVDKHRANGLYPWCKTCKSAYMRNYTRTKPHYHRRKEALRRYGLSWVGYQRMVSEQQGLCAICGEEPKGPLSVDHDHVSKKIRGLLCRSCNFGLGAFRDRIDLLAAATNYLLHGEKEPSVSER